MSNDKYLNQIKLSSSFSPTDSAIVTGDSGTVVANKSQGQINAINQTNGILFGTGSAIRAAIASDFPTLNQDTTGTSQYATNLSGGSSNRLPYQTGAGTTSFDTINSNFMFYINGGGTVTSTNNLPAVTIGTNCTCIDPTTSSSSDINTALSNIYTNVTSIPDPLTLAKGGTNANLTATDGAILYSGSSALALTSATATANQALLSGSSTTPTWSTATYPNTISANNLLYCSSANVLSELATANTAVLGNNTSGSPYSITWDNNFPLVDVSGCICTDPTSGSTTASLGTAITNLDFQSYTTGYNNSISIDTTLTTAQLLITIGTSNTPYGGVYMLCGSCWINMIAQAGDIGKTLIANIYAYNETTSSIISNTARTIFSGVVVNGNETFGGTSSFCVPITIPSQTQYQIKMYIQFTTGTASNDTCTGKAFMSETSL